MIATPTPHSDFAQTWRRRLSVDRTRRTGLVTLFLAALAVGLIGIGNILPQDDEAATVLAVERDWLGVTDLFTSADAPLTPYYLIAKLFTSALAMLPTLTALRALSALAAAVAVAAVYWLVTRRAGVAAGLLTGGLLISIPGFTRYAQEARPYALLLMMTTLAWLAWDRWQRPSKEQGRLNLTAKSVWGGLRYGLALAGTAVISVFGVFHWVAQLLADLTTRAQDLPARVRRLAGTLTAMALGLGLAHLPLALALSRGTGALIQVEMSLMGIVKVLVYSITPFAISPTGPPARAAPILVLAASAVILFAFRVPAVARYRDLTRVLTLWYAVPLALSWAAAVAKPQLLQVRYIIPSLAPLAALAAVGALGIASWLHQLIRTAQADREHRARQVLTTAVPAVGLSLACGAHLAATFPMQSELRQADGHAVRVAAVERRLDPILSDHPDLPLAISPATKAAVIMVVRPDWAERDVLYTRTPTGTSAWPAERSAAEVHESLLGVDELLWLSPDFGQAAPTEPPERLSQDGFVLTSIERIDTWWFCVLRR